MLKITNLGYAHVRNPKNFLIISLIKEQKGKNYENWVKTTVFDEFVKKMEEEMVELYGTAIPEKLLDAIESK